jgi:hypothetical protein
MTGLTCRGIGMISQVMKNGQPEKVTSKLLAEKRSFLFTSRPVGNLDLAYNILYNMLYKITKEKILWKL